MRARQSLKLVFSFAAIALLWCARTQADTNFLVGADFSHLAFFESHGIAYRDGGQAQDGIQILKHHGINCVRLRLFTSSASQAVADPYNYINNTNYTIPLAVRVKNAGLLFCLDFHYSDTWADPGKQAIPAAWTNLNLSQMVAQMRVYNSNTIVAFAAAGAMPDYVQVGNEITSGMLWPMGKVTGNGGTPWSQLGQLMKAAIQGIQDGANAAGQPIPKIIVHIDRGGDWTTTQWFYDNLNGQSVPFDIIGESYYPFYHGSLTNLKTCLTNAAARYGKPVLIAEDAFPWNNSVTNWTNQLYGFPPTPAGQVSFMAAVAGIVKGVPNQLGIGVIYWGSEYQAVNGVNEAGFNNASFFDASGNVLPIIDAVAGMGAPLVIGATIAGSNVNLQWPFSGAAMQLTTSAIPPPSSVWAPVTNPVVISGTAFTVTLPRTNSSLYRLQSK